MSKVSHIFFQVNTAVFSGLTLKCTQPLEDLSNENLD